MPHYEFILVLRESGARAMVQVKSGSASLNAAAYKRPGKTFPFAACGAYGDLIPDDVEAIPPAGHGV